MEESMKTTMLILSVLFFLLFAGKCSQEQTKTPEKPPILLVIGVDYSLTMTGYPEWDKNQYELVCYTMNQYNTEVSVCYRPVGNPINSGFQRLMLNKIPAIDQSAVMSVRAKQKKEVDQISSKNTQAITEFINSITVKSASDKKTCLNEFCNEVSILVNEPQFSSYKKIVCLYSDGFPDCNGDNINEKVLCSLPEEVTFCTIGWKNTDNIKHTGIQYHFSDIEGFISFIKSQTLNQQK